MSSSPSSLPARFAAIADIHGNADALRAVLEDIAAQGVSQIVNLGDVFSGPLAADGVWDLLRHQEIPTVRGNHDRYLITRTPEAMHRTDRVAYDALPPEALEWLRSLPETLSLGEVFLCHATPRSDSLYWLEDVSPDGFVHPATLAQVCDRMGDVTAPLVLCGHTHLPRVVRLGGQLIVNPGSVGCPAYSDSLPHRHVVETRTPDACYALLERVAGHWGVTHRHVPYDSSRMSAAACAQGREDWAHAVSTGWMPG